MKSLGAYWQDLKAKMVGDPMPPQRVAAGWALGMFIGCSVPFGLQLAVSVPLSFVLRVSKIGATVGTLITNPVTIFFIYPAQTWVGCRLLGEPLSWSYIQDVSAKLAKVSLFTAEGWETLSDIGLHVLGGYFFGGLLLALVTTPLTYWIVLHTVVRARAFIAARRKP